MPDQIRKSTNALMAKILDGGFTTEPFPHKALEPALDWETYERLEATFPKSETVYGNETVVNNRAYLLGAHETLNNPDIDPLWKAFFEGVASPEFFRAVLKTVAPYTRQLCPDFEDRLGVKIEDGTLAMRETGEEGDFYFDVQVGVNSPVKRRSRVRAVHVDRQVKMLNALLYMRHPDDQADGGDLELYRWRDARKFERVSAAEEHVVAVAKQPYVRNCMLLFANSPDSLHGVTPRSETPIVRRYINFLLESREPLFDLSDYQVRPSFSRRVQKIWRRVAA